MMLLGLSAWFQQTLFEGPFGSYYFMLTNSLHFNQFVLVDTFTRTFQFVLSII
jgi:hypothetical protein